MDWLTIIYLIGVAVALGASFACVNSFNIKRNLFVVLLCIGTAIMSWIGIGILYIAFFKK